MTTGPDVFRITRVDPDLRSERVVVRGVNVADGRHLTVTKLRSEMLSVGDMLTVDQVLHA